MVIFRTPEGKPGYQPAETVQDAVAVVERLRNDEGVENVRIFRLEEVQFELRPYFKVELATAGEPGAERMGSAPAVFGATDAQELGADAAVEASDGDDELSEEHTAEPATELVAEVVAEVADQVPPPPSAAHPPWAAPPPPPAPVQAPSTEESSDDELSGAGQRRGLFGR